MKLKLKIAGLISIGLITIIACNKEEPLPDNPYDNVAYDNNTSYTDTLDPNSIVSIHRDILLPRCANPGCHDGSFEPDFRTVQSSYMTNVYHNIVKNNVAEEFTYRVIPFDTAGSVLHERITNCCFVNQDDRMPQDNIGTGLDTELVNRISNWIMEGAKDFTGSIPQYPNTEPAFTYYIAIDTLFQTDLGTNRVDDIAFNPFILDYDQELYFIPFVTDDSTSTMDLQNNVLALSLTPDGFDNPLFEIPGVPLNIPNEGAFMLCRFNTNLFNPGDVVYMRFSTNDGDHVDDTEFPMDSSIPAYKSYWSFYVN